MTPASIKVPNTTATAKPAVDMLLPFSCFACWLPADIDERPWIGFAGVTGVEEIGDDEADRFPEVDWTFVANADDVVLERDAAVSAELLGVSELVLEALIGLEELVADVVGTTVTTCDVAIIVLPSFVVTVWGVVVTTAAVWSAL
jgi:hypothetical protein